MNKKTIRRKASLVLVCGLLPMIFGCTKSAEPEPTVEDKAAVAQQQAINAQKSAERQQEIVLQAAKQQLPIPLGPKTIEVTANLDDLDKQIFKGGK